MVALSHFKIFLIANQKSISSPDHKGELKIKAQLDILIEDLTRSFEKRNNLINLDNVNLSIN